MTMRNTAQSSDVSATNPSGSMLRWTFRRGRREITCEVRTDAGAYPFGVHIIRGWDPRRPIVELSATPVHALRRHAGIAMRLREAGWSTERRTG